MSVTVMNSVWEWDLPSNEKIVLLAYADHAAHDGSSVFPSISRIAEKTGYGERWVQLITRKLEAMGLLERDGSGPRGTNRWRIRLAGGEVRAPRNGGEVTSGVKPDAQGGEAQFTGGVRPNSPEPSLTIIEPSTRADLSVIAQSANRTVDYILKPQPSQHYTNREKIPETYLPYADAYHELTGQVPTQRVLHDWLAEFSVWQSEGIDPEQVRQAYEQAAGRFTVLRPGSLTRTAAALKARRSTSPRKSRDPEWHKRADALLQQHLAEGRRRAAEYYSSQGMPFEAPESMRPLLSDVPRLVNGTLDAERECRVPMPDAIRERVSAFLKSKSVPRD